MKALLIKVHNTEKWCFSKASNGDIIDRSLQYGKWCFSRAIFYLITQSLTHKSDSWVIFKQFI